MSSNLSHTFTCFLGKRRVATESLQAVALTLKKMQASATNEPVLVFDNATGRNIDIDTRGTDDEVLARLAASAAPSAPVAPTGEGAPAATDAGAPPSSESRGRGRPKLGVVPREVTLLPRHWEWLAAQSGGASVVLRRLVEEARRAGTDKDRIRLAHERAYHFMSAIAGDLAGFEEATRALFANDRNRFDDQIAAWPVDIRDHAALLGFGTEPQ